MIESFPLSKETELREHSNAYGDYIELKDMVDSFTLTLAEQMELLKYLQEKFEKKTS